MRIRPPRPLFNHLRPASSSNGENFDSPKAGKRDGAWNYNAPLALPLSADVEDPSPNPRQPVAALVTSCDHWLVIAQQFECFLEFSPPETFRR